MKIKFIPIIMFVASAYFYGQEVPQENIRSGAAVSEQLQKGVYTLQDIIIDGVKKYSPAQVLRFTGLVKGEKIELPGQKISNVVKKLWETENFSEVEIYVQDVQGDKVVLLFKLEDLKELGVVEVKMKGKKMSKTKTEKAVKEYKLLPGTKITNDLVASVKNKMSQEYIKKGFSDTKITIVEKINAKAPEIRDWVIEVDKGKRVKIAHIEFEGNESFTDKKLRKKAFKETKQKAFGIARLIKPSRFIQDKYNEDKQNLVNFYQSEGYRDARIVSDSVWRDNENQYRINVKLDEGKKYYIGDITFTGNTVYSTEILSKILGYKTGDIYDAVGFNKKVGEDGGKEDDSDIKSLYQNNGYLFSQVVPVEKSIDGDKINLEIRINEGAKAAWNRVTWSGNTVTHDHVVQRSLYTKPGDWFSKQNIKKTYYTIAGMPYFDPQQITQDIKQNNENNTVDVHWTLVEKGSSTVNLQAGYGGNSFIGTLGLMLNNFSLKKFLKFKSLMPQGDGQTLSIQAQAGQYIQNYSISFTEPWLFGKRPTALSAGVNLSKVNYRDNEGNSQKLDILSASTGLNMQLSWPDMWFSLYTGIQYQKYTFNNYPFQFGNTVENNGSANNFSFNIALSRNSAGFDPIFPTHGSNFEVNFKLTPPYSLFNKKDYSKLLPTQKYNWMEFYKIKLKAETYNTIVGKLVLRSSGEMGFMDGYNKELGAPPFERFYMGGTGLFGGRYDGRELIPLRGYENASTSGYMSTTPYDITPYGGATLYNRFSLELRYPISMNQTAKIYGLAFAEGGNAWGGWGSYNPFQLKRSVGVGVRVYMGMFGLIGFDFAYGFDGTLGSKSPSGWKTHFLMNQTL